MGASGRLTCFSFYPGKNLGAYGDAGAVTCNDLERVQKLRILRDHGSPAKYRHSVVGTNARLDAVQAAILSVKLPYLNGWNALRVRHAKSYAAGFAGSKVGAPAIPPDGEHNFHLFVVRVDGRDAREESLAAERHPDRDSLPRALALDRCLPGSGRIPRLAACRSRRSWRAKSFRCRCIPS